MKEVTNEYIKQDEYVILRIHSDTHGTFDIFIDEEDLEKCKTKKWYINRFNKKMRRKYFYVVDTDGLLLHRLIMNVTDRKQVIDHIDGNMLDNRKKNLQICSTQENAQKQKFRLTNTSGHTGVYWYPYRNLNKWMAKIVVDYKCINLGYYDDIEDAIKARKSAEIKYFGDFQPIRSIDSNEKKTINS